ncbi:hypothetical protein DFH08DRAFT_965772 [Mycena albidolilacea]|uniref:Uncharacterized protein n=1 Tax=Mycena albidolilacea TaxID=1033008 RepID=A0AAD6ZPU9_9AGAR|nr:hypothetical protein DFH08DRAFT_965772 [Mycena albidolilacea]
MLSKRQNRTSTIPPTIQGYRVVGRFFNNSDHIILDTHPYFAFAPNDSLSATSADPLDAGGIWLKQAYSLRDSCLETRCVCSFAFFKWRGPERARGDGRCIMLSQDASVWKDTTPAGVKQLTLALMNTTRDWFLLDVEDGIVRSPLWSYQLGFQNGCMPRPARLRRRLRGPLRRERSL